jgi:mRNA-degrading endonuclease RelE of RelBE toxin-antitoxin system
MALRIDEGFSPRVLRVGNYRALFETEDNKVVIYRVQHRKDVYR